MNRILVRLYVPLMQRQYDVWVPINKSIYYIVNGFLSGINSLNKVNYSTKSFPMLYNKSTAETYNFNDIVIDTDIRNGTELILL